MKMPKKKSEIKKDTKAILKGTYPEQEEATLGENRRQLLVRIPKYIKQRLNLKKGQKIIFKITNKQKLEIQPKKTYLDNYERKIIYLLGTIKATNTTKIANTLEISWATADKKLKKLHSRNYVIKKNNEWLLCES